MPNDVARVIREAAARYGPRLVNVIGTSALEARIAADMESRLGPYEGSSEGYARVPGPRSGWRTEYMGELTPPPPDPAYERTRPRFPEIESSPLVIRRRPSRVEPEIRLDWTPRQTIQAESPKPRRTRFEREWLV